MLGRFLFVGGQMTSHSHTTNSTVAQMNHNRILDALYFFNYEISKTQLRCLMFIAESYKTCKCVFFKDKVVTLFS
jgi:hypothetical protein